MKTIKQLANEFLLLKNALIFCHVRPDGDTLGSAVALSLALKQKGVDSLIVCDGVIPEKFAFLPMLSQIKQPGEIQKIYQAHIAVDVAAEHLLGTAWSIYISAEKRYCLDHHLSNSRFAPNSYIENQPAAALIVYDLIKELQVDFTSDIATAILTGIITDTGNFIHDSTNEKTLHVAGEMVGYGANITKINNELFKNQSKNRAKLYIDTMAKMRFYLEDKLAIIAITLSDLQKYSLNEDATEGFVDYPLSISGVEVAVSLLQAKNNLYRVSIRTKGKLNANSVANEFGGGGHQFASGCVVSGLFEEVIEKIIRAVDINFF